MEQAKEAAAKKRTGKVNQRDCLVFATNLYNFTLCHPGIAKFLPPPVPEEQETLFSENIGKAVLLSWYVKQQEFRAYDQYNLKLLADPNMPKDLHQLFRLILEVNKNIFSAVIYMSALLMEMHLFLYQRNYVCTLKRLPVLWVNIFQTHYAAEFISKGGWLKLKVYARECSKKFDAELDMVFLHQKFNSYGLARLKYITFDRTNQFRLFIVQKTLELLNTIYENILIGEETFLTAINRIKDLSKLLSEIVKWCKDTDIGESDSDIPNSKLKKLTFQFCNKFFNGEDFTKYISRMRRRPCDYQRTADKNSLYKRPEETTELPSIFTEKELESINLKWVDEVAPVRQDLRSVMPPGTDDSNIDSILDEDYTRNLLVKIGGLLVKENIPIIVGTSDVLEELTKARSITGDIFQIGESDMLEEQIMLEANGKSPGQTLQKRGSSSTQITTPLLGATGGASQKSTLSPLSKSTPLAATGGKSSDPTLVSLADYPSLETSMEDLSIWGGNQEHPKAKSSKQTSRKKGSKQ